MQSQADRRSGGLGSRTSACENRNAHNLLSVRQGDHGSFQTYARETSFLPGVLSAEAATGGHSLRSKGSEAAGTSGGTGK